MNLHDDSQDTPKKMVASQGCPRCLETFMQIGADVNSGVYTPPLHAAIDHKNPVCALLLLKAGADVNIRETLRGHTTPLMFAAKQGMENIL